MFDTQNKEILEYLKKHGTITQRQAYTFGCMRLPARISELRSSGFAIKTEMIKVRCKGGRSTRVARYSLV